MSVIEKLWELQTLEDKKVAFERPLKKIPELKELKILKPEIEKDKEKIQLLKQKVAALKLSLKKEEDQINLLREKIDKADSELYSGEISSVKELESAERNIVLIKGKVAEAEDRALTLMDKIEVQRNIIKQYIESFEKKKERFRELNQSYNDQKTGLANSLQQIVDRKEELLEVIPPEVLQPYYKLCSKFDDGKGVALVDKGTCSGCHMTISFDLKKQIKNNQKGSQLICDTCGRWLLVK